jgi:hypothetical protein
VVTIAVPLLMLLFWRTERYYEAVAVDLELGHTPSLPRRRTSIVIVPTSTVNLLTQQALSAALSFGEKVVGVAVAGDEQESELIKRAWVQWNCAVPLEVLIDPHRSLVRSVLRYVESIGSDATIMVLIPQIIPNKRRHEILHNQRARLLESVLKARTDGVVIATLPFHIHD